MTVILAFSPEFAYAAEAEAEDVDGWDVIQRPFQPCGLHRSQLSSSEADSKPHNMVMPPLPSDSEEVIRHWEKANFSTAAPSEGYLSPYLKNYNLGQYNPTRHVLPLRQTAFQAADRLFQTFKGGA